MSDDHIKTVVIDPPLNKRADENPHEQPRSEMPETQQQENHYPATPPPPSWLS